MVDPIQLQPLPSSHGRMYYLFAVLAIVLIGAAGILAILYARPHEDNTQMILGFLGFLGLALSHLVNFIKGNEVIQKTEATHVLVNSQMTEQKRMIAELEYTKGILAGIAQQRERTKELKMESVLDKEREQATSMHSAMTEALHAGRALEPSVAPPPAPLVAPLTGAEVQRVELNVAGTLRPIEEEVEKRAKDVQDKHEDEEKKRQGVS